MSELATITAAESKRLVELEEVIESGIGTFLKVGEALAEIRDSRLYRIEYGTFEDYCREEWNMSKAYAFRAIAAAEVAANLSPMGDTTKPMNERQARPLTKLETPEQQREAWTAATETAEAEGKPVTAKHVEAAVEVVQSRIRPMISKTTPEAEAAAVEAEKDSETLWLLKSYWKKATKKEKAAFIEWMNAA